MQGLWESLQRHTFDARRPGGPRPQELSDPTQNTLT